MIVEDKRSIEEAPVVEEPQPLVEQAQVEEIPAVKSDEQKIKEKEIIPSSVTEENQSDKDT